VWASELNFVCEEVMYERVRATYHNGAFIPAVPVSLPEETEVELIIEPVTMDAATAGLSVEPPLITDPVERARLWEEIIASMQANPIPPNAPRFTRDELHERR
jgi:predicted DNA-binding antitoxin AbrB/MazE fold protein